MSGRDKGESVEPQEIGVAAASSWFEADDRAPGGLTVGHGFDQHAAQLEIAEHDAPRER